MATIEGRQIYAQNLSDFSENYMMIFARDSASTSKDYTLCYDIRRKAVYGDKDGIRHTFRVPYANIAAYSDLQPIFMFMNGKNVNYVMQQYEKPYFVPGTNIYEDPVLTPDNYLVITYMDQFFRVVHTTKIPVVQDDMDSQLEQQVSV